MNQNFGNSIDDYEVGELLGRGAFAEVFKARCILSNRDIAIKRISKAEQTHWNRIVEEVEIHITLRHPSILPLYNVFEDKSYVYLILELCHGHLMDFLKPGYPFTKEKACFYSRNIIEALQYLQSQRIMHRDVKPSNLLLSKEGNVKLADFGLTTRLRRSEDKQTTMCGTPNYMSPEVVSKDPYGLEADVWSFGCVLYHMLTGYPPFEGTTVPETMRAICHRKLKEYPPHVPMDAKDLIGKCLQIDRSKRIELGDILKHRFFNTFRSNTTSLDSGVCTSSLDSSNVSHTNRKNFARKFINGSWSDASPPVKMSKPKSQHIQLVNKNDNLKKCVGLPYKQTLPNVELCPQVRQDVSESPVNCQILREPLLRLALSNQADKPQRDDFQPCCRPSRSKDQKNHLTGDKPLIRTCSLDRDRHYIQVDSPNHFHNRDYRSHSPNHSPLNCLRYEPSAQIDFNSPHSKRNSHSVSYSNKYDPDHEEITGEAPMLLNKTQKRKSEVLTASPRKEEFSLQSLCLPLSTVRLRPMHQKLDDDSGFFNILENGDFCLCLIKKKEQKEALILFNISQDGDKIWIKLMPCNPSYKDNPPNIIGPPNFTYKNLPSKHHRIYAYAKKLADGVRAKTAKITYYKEKSKFFLMENGPNPNFEALFQTGERFIFTEDDLLMKDKINGEHSIKNQIHLLEKFKQLIDIAEAEKDFCLELEEKMSYFNSKGIFPMIVGRRPSTKAPPKSKGESCKENVLPASSYQSSYSSCISNVCRKIGSYEGSLSAITEGQRLPLNSINNNNNDILHQRPVEYAAESINGEMTMIFTDGTKIARTPNGWCYIDSKNKRFRIDNGPQDKLPPSLNDTKIRLFFEFLIKNKYNMELFRK